MAKMIDPPFTVNFIERRDSASTSIESVFRCVADELRGLGISIVFQKLPYGNNLSGILKNLAGFRPKPADIFHITGHVHYMALRLPRDRTILTVHDLGVLKSRTGLRREILKWLFFRLPAVRLKYVTAVSEHTRTELAALPGIKGKTILVIDNPLIPGFEKKKAEFNNSMPTILQVGTAPNKNLSNLIDAIQPLNCMLRIIGEIPSAEKARLHKADIRFENHVRLDRAKLAELYRDSDMLVFASQYEGFGLPILEAQASGLPIVTSNSEPMRTVAGGGAVLVDQNDPKSILEGIQTLIRDEALRRELIEKGFKNIQRFSPTRVASEYLAVYEEIIKSAGHLKLD